jgi:hypothetical protein
MVQIVAACTYRSGWRQRVRGLTLLISLTSFCFGVYIVNYSMVRIVAA